MQAVEAAKAGTKALSYASRVGSEAVKQAVEMAVYSSGDEVAKMVLNDPEASTETAIANVGLNAALGGAGGALFAGAINPLWKATIGDKAEKFLGDLTSRLGGIDGVAGQAETLGAKAGIEIPDVVAAKIDNKPYAGEMFSALSQTDTSFGGKKLQETTKKFYDDVGEAAANAFGHDSKYAKELGTLDKYSEGVKATKDLAADLESQYKPIQESYDFFNEQFPKASVDKTQLPAIMDKIAEKSIEKGWAKAADDAQTKLMEKVLEKLPLQETAEDLKKFVTNLRGSHPYGSPTYEAARDISKILEEARGNTVARAIETAGGTAEQVAANAKRYADTKTGYASFMDKLDTLNEHLHVGRYDGPKSFFKAVKELGETSGENALGRLLGKNKAQVLEVLGTISPNTLGRVRQFHVDDLLRSATKDGVVNPNALIKNFEKLSPQLQSLIMDETQSSKLSAIKEILQKTADPTHNWSNTARTADKIAKGAVSPITMIAGLMGHGAAAVMAHLGGIGLNEGKDALKLGMLKFLGSNQPIKADGFKAMVSFMEEAVKGEAKLTKATANVFKAGMQVVPEHAFPSKEDNDKLDKKLTKLQEAPNKMFEAAEGRVGHYMPDHQTAIASTTVRAAQYLQSLKPKPHKLGPLDAEVPPLPSEEARYQRALTIANNPLTVLERVKEGTIQPSDVQDLNALYPSLYKQMVQKMTDEMTGAVSPKGHKGAIKTQAIPYKTRMGASLFMGTPLDASMQPMAIQAAQQKSPAQQQQNSLGGGHKGSTSKLGSKTNAMYQTPGQAAEADRSGRS